MPQYTIQNRNVHISVLIGALWDIGQVHCGICELGLFFRQKKTCLYFSQYCDCWFPDNGTNWGIRRNVIDLISTEYSYIFHIERVGGYIDESDGDCKCVRYIDRADSRFAPSQWETALLCNNMSLAGRKPSISPVSRCCWFCLLVLEYMSYSRSLRKRLKM